MPAIPTLFNFVVDLILRNALTGVPEGVQLSATFALTKLNYADDIALLGDSFVAVQEAVNPLHRFAAVVVVVESPQTPEDDSEKRRRTRWETGKFIDGLPMSNHSRPASKAGRRSHKWPYIPSSSLHNRHVAPSDRLIRCCQQRRAG